MAPTASAAADMPLDAEEIRDALWFLRQSREQINEVADDLVNIAPVPAQQAVCSMWGARVRTGRSRGYLMTSCNPVPACFHPATFHAETFIGTLATASSSKTESVQSDRVLRVLISCNLFLLMG